MGLSGKVSGQTKKLLEDQKNGLGSRKKWFELSGNIAERSEKIAGRLKK